MTKKVSESAAQVSELLLNGTAAWKMPFSAVYSLYVRNYR